MNGSDQNHNLKGISIMSESRKSYNEQQAHAVLQSAPQQRTPSKRGLLIVGAAIVALELFAPDGAKPTTIIGEAYGRIVEGQGKGSRSAMACAISVDRLAERLSVAKRNYSQSLGNCTTTTLLDLLEPGAGQQTNAICQQMVRDKFEPDISQIELDLAEAKKCLD